MQDILIIGNGFDLYHKLPTRYTDFLFLVKNWNSFYAKFEENYKECSECEQFVVRVNENGKLTDEALTDFVNHASALNADRLKQLNIIIEKNPWIRYFIETEYEKDGWIDFEAEMESVFVYTELFFSEEVLKCEKKILSQTINPHCLKVIYSLMKNTDSLPLNIGVYSKRDIENFLYGDIKKNLLKELQIALNELVEALDIYMEEFVGNIKPNVYSEQIKGLSNINLLNFNYTYTYQTVYGGVNLHQQHQIHGSLKEKDIILGISDKDFNNLDYIYFQKYFQRIQKRTGSFYKDWIPKDFSSLEDVPINIFIMGHSLGETDKDVLSEFFLNKRSVNKITIFYHNQKAYEDLVIALIKLYGKEFVIEETGTGRIEFVELKDAVEGSGKSSY